MHPILPQPYYRILLIGLLLISLAALWTLNQQILSNTNYIPVDDFGHYWAAGRLTLLGVNPYDPDNVQIERNAAIGSASEYAVVPIMWTPPWTIPLVLPLSLLPYPLSRLSWLLINIACILVSSDYLWRLYGGQRKLMWLAWLCAFTFGPTISVLQKGQPTALILVGFTGFLYLISKTDSQTVRNDWLAGFWASLITIKPQLYYLFWPVLLFWCFQTRRWAAIGGAISGVLVGALVTMTFNPVVIQQYVGAIIGNPPSAWATPTIGGYLRLIFGLEKFWLQFLSPILGVLGVTALWIWRTLKKTEAAWNWLQDSPALLFAAVLTAAYAWTYDQVILLPTMIMILAAASQSSRRGYLWALLAALTAINFMDLILHRWLDEFWFGWLAPAYLLWFVVSYRLTLQNQQAPARTAAGSALL